MTKKCCRNCRNIQGVYCKINGKRVYIAYKPNGCKNFDAKGFSCVEGILA